MNLSKVLNVNDNVITKVLSKFTNDEIRVIQRYNMELTQQLMKK